MLKFEAINLIALFMQWFCSKSEKQVPGDLLNLHKEPQATLGNFGLGQDTDNITCILEQTWT